MRWDIAPRTRCDIIGFSGINFSGTRRHCAIYPAGGKQGDDIDGAHLQSVIVVAPEGTRVTFITTALETGWEERTWRSIEIRKGACYKTKDGDLAARAPDLDFLDKPNAMRCDPDFQASFDEVGTPDKGKGWTYGHMTGDDLKDNIRAIKVEKLPPVAK